jgi:hypothetical protein
MAIYFGLLTLLLNIGNYMKISQQIVNYLNMLIAYDNQAIQDLIDARVNCNVLLANHATCQVRINPKYNVGILGVLNGLCEHHGECRGAIIAMYEDGRLIGFKVQEDS